jgi:hypothetical protein
LGKCGFIFDRVIVWKSVEKGVSLETGVVGSPVKPSQFGLGPLPCPGLGSSLLLSPSFPSFLSVGGRGEEKGFLCKGGFRVCFEWERSGDGGGTKGFLVADGGGHRPGISQLSQVRCETLCRLGRVKWLRLAASI